MAESSTRSRTVVRSLNREGSAYLSNYARTVNAYPLRAEKLAILATLHAIPGNDAVTLPKLTNWFARHRYTSHDTHTRVLFDDETILFPKLTPTHLQQLRVLYKKLNDPTEGVITFWAKRITAERKEVAAWIEYQQEKGKEISTSATSESPVVSPTTASEFPRPHLPTPAESLSPQTRMPSLPPIAIKAEDPSQPVSSFGTTSLIPRPPPPTEPPSALPPCQQQAAQARTCDVQTNPPPVSNALPRVAGQPPLRHSNTTLTARIRESLRPDTAPSESPPRSAVEFAEKFGQVENMIDAFMKKYQAGQLVWLGWDSSLGKSVS